jgi:hypothetical protein
MRAPHFGSPFDTRSAVRRLLEAGMEESEADAVVDVVGAATDPLVTREILRAEIYRALIIQTGVFAGIVAALVTIIVALLTRL